jgi:aminoglycoside phosphotransferase (APT) family kinase protein
VTDYLQVHTSGWLDHFARSGHPDVEPLAAGTEGAIYRLGDGTVAKVWGHHDVEELARMRLFYQDVAAAGPPFATPEILSVETVRGTAVTVERELPGVQLRKLLSPDDRQVPPEAEECLLTVLRELAAIEGTAPMRRLPVLGEKAALWEGHRDFVTGLVALVERRVPAHAGLFRRRVRGFDRTYERLLGRLAALQVSGHSVIHGDLFPENILVDQDLRPTAVLDFGFLSTAGDPRFDAAMSAAIFDMYGPYAREISGRLTARISREFGYPEDVLLLYRAAYALATGTFFSDDGSDGHFAWCAAVLDDPAVAAILTP